MGLKEDAPGLFSTPRINPTAFVAPGAVIVGDVVVGGEASVWYGCVLRADQNSIEIGEGSNVQDNCVLHCDHPAFPGTPVRIGVDVTIGHACVLHGCHVEDGVLVGNGSVVLDGAVLGERCLIAAGSTVPPGFQAPARHLIAGTPAAVKRELTEEEISELSRPPEIYRRLANAHRNGPNMVGEG